MLIFSRMKQILGFHRNIKVLCLFSILGATAYGILMVVFPLYVIELKATEVDLGLLTMISSAMMTLFSLPGGYLTDELGRKRTMILGSLIYALSPASYLLASEWTHLIPGAVLSGAGYGLFSSATTVAIADSSRLDRLATSFGIVNAIGMLGTVIGPILGGIVTDYFGAQSFVYGMRVSLFIAFSIGIVGLIPLFYYSEVKEKKGGDTRHRLRAYFQYTIKTRTIVPYCVAQFLVGFGAGLVVPFFTIFYSERFQASPTTIGIIFMVSNLILSLSYFPGGILADRYNKIKVIILTNTLGFCAAFGIIYSPLITVSAAFFILRNTIVNMCGPVWSAMLMEAFHPVDRGKSSGVMNMSWNVGNTITPVFGGWIINSVDPGLPFLLAGGIYVIAVFLFFTLNRMIKTEG